MTLAKPRTTTEHRTESDRPSSLRRYFGLVLATYWVTLFLATHVPLPELPGDTPGADKLVHLLAYGVLGLLLTIWAALRTRLRGTILLLLLWGTVTVYGALDEWLQQFVDRTPDLGDWTADVLGGSIGIGIVWLLQRVRPLPLQNLGEESR